MSRPARTELPARRPLRIAVIGGGRCSSREAERAEEVGRRVAEAGAVLVSGGLSGVMAAACRGARASGGLTVGILPGARAAEANPDVVIPIPTGMGEARNALVVQSADAVVAVGGELGTLSEIAFALRAGKPVVGLGSWELDPARTGGREILPAETPEEAVGLALEKARG